MEQKPLKIAFSGPSGLGKTTLCKFVSDRFEVSHLSTSAGDIMNNQDKELLGKKFGYHSQGHKAVINKSSANPDFGIAFQNMILARRAHQISDNNNMVIDRSPLDNVSYMLSQIAHNMTESGIQTFVEEAQEAWRELTHVIIIKHSNDIPRIEDNGSRVPNKFFQQYISDVFSGTYFRFFANQPGPQVIFIDYWDLNDRKRLVEDFIRDSGQTEMDLKPS